MPTVAPGPIGRRVPDPLPIPRMTRRTRLCVLLLIAVMLVPNPLTSMRPPERNDSQLITARPVAIDPDRPGMARIGELIITEAWELDSPNSGFGGYSALVLLGDRRFLLGSDTGLLAGLTLAGNGRIAQSFVKRPLGRPGQTKSKAQRDLEALTRDGATGRIWAAYENSNQIWRFSADMARPDGHVAPATMRRWHANGGPEAMVRLTDGRFLLLSETTGTRGGHGTAGVLFPTDPVQSPKVKPLLFAYDAQGKGRVTDAAQLPDGRILLLHRQLSLFDGFTSTLAVADIADIDTGMNKRRIWRSKTIATFRPPLITENFEGLAIEDSPDGAVIWMIADDNLAKWQRTLLLRMLLPRGRGEAASRSLNAVR